MSPYLSTRAVSSEIESQAIKHIATCGPKTPTASAQRFITAVLQCIVLFLAVLAAQVDPTRTLLMAYILTRRESTPEVPESVFASN